MPWSRRFDDPIKPPKGKTLVTLEDAAAHIMKLPKSKQQAPEWQAAVNSGTVSGCHSPGVVRPRERNKAAPSTVPGI